MAGRLILIALVCAISGLLIAALASIKSLYPIHKKPTGIGLFFGCADDSRSEIHQLGDMEWRSSVKSALPGNDPIKVKHQEERRVAFERSTRKEKDDDSALMVSVESLMKRQKTTEEVTLVDVRDHRAFQECHIPGSINVPLYALKTKKYLSSAFVVLVDKGFPCTQLAEQCRQLRASGFMVWVLEGGVNGWREAGAPLQGELLVKSQVNRLSPKELFEERYNDRWLGVDARKARKSKEALPFLKVIAIGSPEHVEAPVAPLVDYQRKEKGQPLRTFLVFNEHGRDYEKVEKMMRKAGVKNAFYLIGGLAGYNAFLTQSAALLQKDDQSGGIVGRCTGCP